MAEGKIVMKRCYLVTTEHLEDGLWFRDEEDFRVGMNHVAIEASRQTEVIVLAFTLMSNHLHFVLGGEKEAVAQFVDGLKRSYSMYLNRKYGTREFLRRNKADVREVSEEDEALERAIAYVQMNCVAANICSHPSQYPWGTGSTFFDSGTRSGTQLGQLSERARKRLMHSDRCACPGHWMVGEGGYVLPREYVQVSLVEKLFRTPARMNYFLKTSSKARRRLETGEEKLPAFRDHIILSALPDLLRSLFQKDTFRELTVEEQTELMRQVRFRFSADINQVARVCGITYAEAARMSDCV